jgi:Cu(I)/Ag(I) efflux system membrane fusion protein/cobalt-zinc-cadmium efflux system membrane fusion protein
MEGATIMIRNSLRAFALLTAIALAISAVFSGKVVAFFQHDHKDTGSVSKAASQTKERKVLFWYDSMNPQRTYDKPGKAPDGMDLVPKYAEGDEDSLNTMPVGTVKISPQNQQVIGVQTAVVRHEPLVRTLRTTGQITANETKIAHVHVKINGFIEDVFVDYVGQLVKKRQPLFTLYSPDLVSAQEEYLIAKRGDQYLSGSQFAEVSQGAQSLLRSAREPL